MTFTEARDILVTHTSATLTAHAPTLPVEWENTESVDIATVGDRFVQVEVVFDDKVRLTQSDDLMTKVTGTVSFRLFLKAGKGTRTGLQIFDTLAAHIGDRTLSGITVGTPYPGRRMSADGWASHDLIVPFEYFS